MPLACRYALIDECGAHGCPHLAALVPRQPQAAGDGSRSHQTDSTQHHLQIARTVAVLPERGQGADDAVCIRVVDALIPAARALGEIRVVADRVERRLQDAVLPGLRVLRHEEDMAPALAANLVDELGEGG